MRVFLTGGTGLIGRRLVQKLVGRGDQPVVLTRQADRAKLNPALTGCELVQGDPTSSGPWDKAVDGCDAVVNLVGHNLFADRWSPAVKRKIRDSRVYGTENVVAAMARASAPPPVLVQGSAIGYYGPLGDEELTESSPSGTDFLGVVCREWEDASHPAETLGARLAILRTGIVLAAGEGALKLMTPLFKWGPGAPIGGGAIGTGQHWMSWIHLEDIVGLFLMALDNPGARGPINGTAPHPVRNADFARTLSRNLWRPHAFWRIYIPVGPPDFLLNVVLGDVAQIITTGQKVLPARAQELGYTFQFPDLEGALADLLPRPKTTPKPTPIVLGH